MRSTRLGIKRLHTQMVKKTALYGWGQSHALPLKKGHMNRVFLQPTRLDTQEDFALSSLSKENSRVTHIAAGWGHSLVATTGSKVHSFGINRSGQLGRRSSPGNDTSASATEHIVFIPQCKNGRIQFLACGREHSHVVIEDENSSQLYSFGNNMYGQLGLGKDKGTVPGSMMCENEPQKVVFSGTIQHITCGMDHTIFATDDAIYGMGWSADGQLGQGAKDKSCPSKIPLFSTSPVKKLSTSTDFTLMLDKSGSLCTWGNSEYGQGAQGKIIDRILEPLMIEGVQDVVDVAAGGPFSVFLKDNGKVYTCGYGALGLGKDTIQTLQLTEIDGLNNVERVFATTDFAAAITANGELFTWGLNGASGRLGQGHCEHAFKPKLVAIGKRVLDLALGINHVLALCED